MRIQQQPRIKAQLAKQGRIPQRTLSRATSTTSDGFDPLCSNKNVEGLGDGAVDNTTLSNLQLVKTAYEAILYISHIILTSSSYECRRK